MAMQSLINKVREQIPDPEDGLPEEVFLFVSELTPLVNTDLLVRDSYGRILLAWRKDPWWGEGWHVPGGVLRLHETFEDRIKRTAEAELHTAVSFSEEPIEIRSIIAREFKQRSHHITFVYDCRVSDEYQIDNGVLKVHDAGFLAWHDRYPKEMLKCHEFYRKYFKVQKGG